ncbi:MULTISPECIES: HAD family hydrolase [Streptomyces]|uniref:HAD family hydrolase n=1 Tax=Streptomyces TaxID=1883 RepID=UPI0013C48A4A|nr:MULTISPECIES: HAD family hydrolase [Streptomyces]MDX3067052.1 HAD family hydrolase [Streptomyces sp. ND04-05B]MDX3519524.1 HAD family hydrolase [Streptomyces scabiei]
MNPDPHQPLAPPLPAVTTVLFDIDNTLIPTRAIWQRALHAVAARLADAHPGVSAAVIASTYVNTSDRLWGNYDHALAPLGSHTAARRHVWEVALREAGIELGERQLTAHVDDFAHRQVRAIRPVPSTVDAFRRLAQVYQLGVITNGDADHQHAKLKQAGLDPYFETVVCALGNGHRKPHPAPFHRACEELAVRPEQCLYVGDEWDTDVVGARAAGLHPVWITATGQSPPGSGPTTRFTSLASCLTVLCDHAASKPIRETEPT